jgi:hypothetical protein
VSGVPWLTITGSGSDDWIYWRLLLQSLLITIKYNSSQSIYCRGLAPFPFSRLNSVTTCEVNYCTELTQHSHVSSIYDLGKNRVEITTSNSSSIIMCLSVPAETRVGTAHNGASARQSQARNHPLLSKGWVNDCCYVGSARIRDNSRRPSLGNGRVYYWSHSRLYKKI